MKSMFRRSRLARFGLKLATALGAGAVAASTPAAAQSMSPQEAPTEWLRYAEYATARVNAWLEAESEVAARLRAYLDATRPAPDQPTAALLLRLWIDRDGTVSRIEHIPFAHVQANDDLKTLIVGVRLDAVPPEDMLLPLRILIQLPPPPEPEGQASVSSLLPD